MNYYLNIKEAHFLNESLCAYGMLIQNNQEFIVKRSTTCQVPYMVITEGIIFSPKDYPNINNSVNIEVFKNNEVILKKVTIDTEPILKLDATFLDLYEDQDKELFDNIFAEWNNEDKVYLRNTEILPNVNKTKCIVGVASGNYLSQLAYNNQITHVVFYDYKDKALDFQKELISSNDRKQVYFKYLDKLVMGQDSASITDIENVDFEMLNKWYDYLRTVKVEFIQVDLRYKNNIINLIQKIPKDSTLWVSNIFTYITTTHTYDIKICEILEKECAKKNIEILPYTKVKYEG
jgi:hypothetical protein